MQAERQPSMRRAASQLALALLVLIATNPVAAQPASIYPSEGQTPAQQDTDRLECDKRAAQETGFDPARPPAEALQRAANMAQLGMMRDSATHATGGLVGDPAVGAGVPAGRLPSALFGTRRGADLQRQQEALQRQTVAAIDDQNASYDQAMSSCLRVRGYVVR